MPIDLNMAIFVLTMTQSIILSLVDVRRVIPYSGKFSYGANFRIFRMLHPLYENKNCENLNVRKIFSLSRMTYDLYAYHGHTRSLVAGAKCKASSLNDVSQGCS